LAEADEILLTVSAGVSLWWSAVRLYIEPVLWLLAAMLVAFIVSKLIVR